MKRGDGLRTHGLRARHGEEAMELTTERKIVKEVATAILGGKNGEPQVSWLKKTETHVNLTSRRFQHIWKGWWREDVPPRLEIDLVLVFEDTSRKIDQMLMGAVEIKFFPSGRERKMNFYEGVHQALAAALFGFDGLGLWHLFATDTSPELIRGYAKGMQELISGFRLPVFYVAGRLVDLPIVESFAPAEGITQGVRYFADWMRDAWSQGQQRNPLLESDEVKKRRSTLKAVLQVPV